MFEESVALWRLYRLAHEDAFDSNQAYAAGVVSRRLNELDFIFGEIEQNLLVNEAAWAELFPNSEPEYEERRYTGEQEADYRRRLFDTTMRVRIYGEYFYNSSHRVAKSLSSLPQLSGFQSVGARRVRNQVLEHPPSFENFGKFVAQIAGNGGPIGSAEWLTLDIDTSAAPAMSPGIGLRTHATEFRDELARVLRQAVPPS